VCSFAQRKRKFQVCARTAFFLSPQEERYFVRGLVYVRVILPLCLLSVIGCFSVGCGGGSSKSSGGTESGINVQVTSPTGAASLDANQTLPIAVTVTNDTGSAGVAWSVALASGQTALGNTDAGSFSTSQSSAATYQPPSSASVASWPLQVVVTATSVTDSTRSAAIPVSIYSVPSITTASSDLAPAYVGTDYSCVQSPITSAT